MKKFLCFVTVAILDEGVGCQIQFWKDLTLLFWLLNWLSGFIEDFPIYICQNKPNLHIFDKNLQNASYVSTTPVTYIPLKWDYCSNLCLFEEKVFKIVYARRTDWTPSDGNSSGELKIHFKTDLFKLDLRNANRKLP